MTSTLFLWRRKHKPCSEIFGTFLGRIQIKRSICFTRSSCMGKGNCSPDSDECTSAWGGVLEWDGLEARDDRRLQVWDSLMHCLLSQPEESI